MSSENEPEFERSPCPYPDYEPTGYDPEEVPATGEGAEGVERVVWSALYGVEDPEMPISVVDLGLVYGVRVLDGPEGTHAAVDVTLTYTGCPAREMLLDEIEAAAAGADGVDSASVELVWSPPWSIEMVTDRGKEDLREFGLSV